MVREKGGTRSDAGERTSQNRRAFADEGAVPQNDGSPGGKETPGDSSLLSKDPEEVGRELNGQGSWRGGDTPMEGSLWRKKKKVSHDHETTPGIEGGGSLSSCRQLRGGGRFACIYVGKNLFQRRLGGKKGVDGALLCRKGPPLSRGSGREKIWSLGGPLKEKKKERKG